MPTIWLVRHGEVFNPNHVVYADLPGFHLSPLGVLQAHGAGHHLASQPVDVVLTSPLARARETATAIARHHGLVPHVDARLTETRQYPGWTGMRWDDVATHLTHQLDGYLRDASKLDDVDETIEEVAARSLASIDDQVAAGRRAIVVVGHQDPIQATRLSLLGRSLSELLVDPPGHGSVTSLVQDAPGRWIEMASWKPAAGS